MVEKIKTKQEKRFYRYKSLKNLFLVSAFSDKESLYLVFDSFKLANTERLDFNILNFLNVVLSTTSKRLKYIAKNNPVVINNVFNYNDNKLTKLKNDVLLLVFKN